MIAVQQATSRVLDFLFGCTHANKTWPRGKWPGPYKQICLDCGKELPYTGELRVSNQ